MLLQWLGQASFKIKTGELIIYIDPYGNEDYYAETANLVLVSRWEYSHCSVAILKKIRGDNTTIVGTPEVASQFYGCNTMYVGEKREYGPVRVLAVPADFTPIKGTKETGLGFVLEIEKKKIYYTSDTDYFKGMENIKPDIIIIPVGGTKTTSAKQAVELVRLIKPKIAVPAHYGKMVGTLDDAELFKELVEAAWETKVIILKEGEIMEA